MDDSRERPAANLRKRHEAQIRECAERIQGYVGHVLNRLNSGHSASVGYFAQGIEADAREMRSRVAALEAIEEILGVLASGDPS